MSTLLSKTQLSRRADMDSRTVANRIKTLAIQPAAVLGNGRALYSADVVQQLKATAPTPAGATP
jgi:hypothetical protein